MTPELAVADEQACGELKQELATLRSKIEANLPPGFNFGNKMFVDQYLRAQWRIAKGKKEKAAKILHGLDSNSSFKDFEEKNEALLAAIDIAVTGSSNRQDDFGDKIEPLFRTS